MQIVSNKPHTQEVQNEDPAQNTTAITYPCPQNDLTVENPSALT